MPIPVSNSGNSRVSMTWPTVPSMESLGMSMTLKGSRLIPTTSWISVGKTTTSKKLFGLAWDQFFLSVLASSLPSSSRSWASFGVSSKPVVTAVAARRRRQSVGNTWKIDLEKVNRRRAHHLELRRSRAVEWNLDWAFYYSVLMSSSCKHI